MSDCEFFKSTFQYRKKKVVGRKNKNLNKTQNDLAFKNHICQIEIASFKLKGKISSHVSRKFVYVFKVLKNILRIVEIFRIRFFKCL